MVFDGMVRQGHCEQTCLRADMLALRLTALWNGMEYRMGTLVHEGEEWLLIAYCVYFERGRGKGGGGIEIRWACLLF